MPSIMASSSAGTPAVDDAINGQGKTVATVVKSGEYEARRLQAHCESIQIWHGLPPILFRLVPERRQLTGVLAHRQLGSVTTLER